MRTSPAVLAALAACALMIGPVTASGQETALDGVERLMAEARYEPARQALELWWAEQWPEAGRVDRERGLWLRGLLTVDPAMAERDFLRVVVEYRGGAHVDDALLRLAHIEEASLDYDAAIRDLEVLLRDHAGSPHESDARAMVERLRELPPPEPPDLTAPDTDLPQPLEPTLMSPGDSAVAAFPAAGTDGDTADVEPDPGPARPTVYSIQLGVFSTESRAYTLAATADALGVEVRLARLPGSDMVHVRSGSFETRTDAESFARDVQLTGLSAVVFDDAALEESILPGILD